MATPPVSRLVVFSDDWGRHPSSAQHLVGRLLDRHPTLWVNTIGTRRPGLSWGDLQKIGVKLRQWTHPVRSPARGGRPGNLTVLTPRMWPGFRRRWQRRLNGALIGAAVNRALGPRGLSERRVVLTTLPITADLVGHVDADYWVYYCVDDWSTWPGVDGPTLGAMERLLVGRCAALVAVSETLRERLSAPGRAAALLTHGIDLDHWRTPPTAGALPEWWGRLRRPIILFWGLIDRRLDSAWLEALCAPASRGAGTVVLVGPRQAPEAHLAGLPGLVMPGAVAYADLPALAAAAAALVMPYADLPVTRAMQPLKLLEYLATGKPVIVRDLPATRPWEKAADVVAEAAEFVRLVRLRVATGVPAEQLAARGALRSESWDQKARQFEQMIFGAAR